MKEPLMFTQYRRPLCDFQYIEMYELEMLEFKAMALFFNGFFKGSALFYVQAHCLISNLAIFPEFFGSTICPETQIQDIRLLLNASFKNITQKINRLFRIPLEKQLLELPNLLKDPTNPSFDIVPDNRAEWIFMSH
jgi:hypothetical protein